MQKNKCDAEQAQDESKASECKANDECKADEKSCKDAKDITNTETDIETDTESSSHEVSTAGFEEKTNPEPSASGERWFEAGRERYKAERFDESAEAYENAARRHYREDVAWYNSACSWSLAGQRDAALGALLHSIDAGFGDLDQIETDSDLAAIRKDARYPLLLQRARRTDAGVQKREAALSQFESLSESGERDANEWRSAGISLLRSGEPDRAARAFEAEIALDSSASGIYNLACAQARGKHTSAALATLERAVLMGYGDSHDLSSDEDLASLHGEPGFDRIAELADDLTLFSHGRGDDDTRAWRRDLPRFERVTHEHPSAGRGWFNLGYAQLRLADLDASERAFSHALDLGYRTATTSYNLACVSARQRDVDGAFRWLDRAERAGMDVSGMVRGDGDLDAIRSDARYRAILDRWDHDKAQARERKSWKEKDKEKQQKATG